jgi:hypothetical protein
MFRDDAVMARLRRAKPAEGVGTDNEQLKDRIVSQTPDWRLSSRAAASARRHARVPPFSRSRRVLSGLAASGLAAVALVVVLIVSVSGPVPTVAQAFPALTTPSTPIPAALQQSLNEYGTAPNALDIATGHRVHTPWGTGYVITGYHGRLVCVIAPGTSAADWGASCALAKQAAASGTMKDEYAYDAATHTARLIALLPKDATVTMQTSGGAEHHLSLQDGLLATQISGPTTVKITINNHTTVAQFGPRNTVPALGSLTSGQNGASTTVVATTVTTAP